MNNDQTLRFKYKFTTSSAVLMVLAAFAVTVSLGYFASHPPDARLTRLLSRLLSPEAPFIVFWGLTALSLFASIFATRAAFSSSNSINHIELGPSSALLPSASITMSPITIPYRFIRQIRVMNIQNHQMAVISSSVGESRLLSKFFASPGDFTAFLLALEQRRHS
jgi:hypothetical protein